MKHLIALISILVMTVSVVAAAEPKVALFGYGYDGERFRASSYEVRPSIGVGWYHDHRQYQADVQVSFDPEDALAMFVQIPVAKVYDLDVCFGLITPLGFAERSACEFSLAYMLNDHIELSVGWISNIYSAFSTMVGWRF